MITRTPRPEPAASHPEIEQYDFVRKPVSGALVPGDQRPAGTDWRPGRDRLERDRLEGGGGTDQRPTGTDWRPGRDRSEPAENRSEADGGAEFLHAVGALPGEVGLPPA